MAADTELLGQVLRYFIWAWNDDSFTDATEVRKLYPTQRQWVQLSAVFNQAPWVKARHIKLALRDFEPKAIKTIRQIADVIDRKTRNPELLTEKEKKQLDASFARVAEWKSSSTA